MALCFVSICALTELMIISSILLEQVIEAVMVTLFASTNWVKLKGSAYKSGHEPAISAPAIQTCIAKSQHVPNASAASPLKVSAIKGA